LIKQQQNGKTGWSQVSQRLWVGSALHDILNTHHATAAGTDPHQDVASIESLSRQSPPGISKAKGVSLSCVCQAALLPCCAPFLLRF
jgi:hypothetical protein